MNGAKPFPVAGIITEKRTRIGQPVKDASVFEHANLVRINDNFSFLTRIPVEYQKTVISPLFPDDMNKSEMSTALAALETFKGDINQSPFTVCSARWQDRIRAQ
jgi:hypothetical protein